MELFPDDTVIFLVFVIYNLLAGINGKLLSLIIIGTVSVLRKAGTVMPYFGAGTECIRSSGIAVNVSAGHCPPR